LGGLGGRRHRGGAPALRAQAARLATDVGRARGARRDRDGPAHLRRGARRPGRALHRRRRAAHARRLALVARRSLPGQSQDARALRARVHAGPQGRGVAGSQPQRDLVPAQLLPAAAARRDPQDRLRALVDRALEQGARLRGHADLDRPRLRLLDRRGPPRAHRLEDGRRRSRRGRLPARLLRALREGHARRGPREGGPRGGQPARADGDAAPLGRRQAGRHPGAAAAVHPRDEGLSRRSRRERRGDGRLRAYGRAADLPVVQFPGRVPPRALAVPVRRALFPLVLGLCAAGLATSPAPAAITTIEVRRPAPSADEASALALSDPSRPEHAGNGFAFRLGYTLVWTGWDAEAPATNVGMRARVPVATAGAAPIVRPIRDEFVFGTRLPAASPTAPLSYEAATLEQARARLTVRARQGDPPVEIPAAQWTFKGPRAIALAPEGTPFKPGFIYDFHYTAKDPKVLGIGFAATRDLLAFLRYEATDRAGTPNPVTLGPDVTGIRATLALGIS